MSERRRATVTRWDIEAKLRQIHDSLQALLQQVKEQVKGQVKELPKKAAVPAGSVLVFFAWLRRRRKKRRTIVEVRRA